jgi:hypothetical protein
LKSTASHDVASGVYQALGDATAVIAGGDARAQFMAGPKEPDEMTQRELIAELKERGFVSSGLKVGWCISNPGVPAFILALES